MSNYTGRTPTVNLSFRWVRPVLIVIAVIIVIAVLAALASPHFYFFKQVSPEQVGIKIRGGQIVDIVPPGVYSDVGLFVKLETYSTAAYQFTVEDPEVLTKDQQRVGVRVAGSVFRPTSSSEDLIHNLWGQYRSVFLSDDSLQRVMNDLSMQAMKVCIGDRPFIESVVGSSRDAVRNCVDDVLNELVQPYGLSVANITVPNVTLSPEVQAKLDAITQSRLDTEKARQDEQKAIAEGKAQQAQQEAAIRVEQAKKQEETRQQTILATLDQAKLEAQMAVIEAQKANDLLAAQKDLEIAQAKAAAAAEQAKADLAQQMALAELYARNPGYLQLMITQANASAIKETDKIIFAPNGEFPYLVLGNSVVPTFNVPNTYGPTTNSETTP